MTDTWINIDKLGVVGVETDLMSIHREPQSLDDAVNVRSLGPNLANAGGYTVVSNGTLPHAANTLFLAKDTAQRLLVTCAKGDIYQFDGTTWTDITGTAVGDGSQSDARWTGGWLTGALTLANEQVVRTFKPGVDTTTQPMQYDPGTGDTWESLGNTAEVFRPFREYMMAGNVKWGADHYPSRIQWCHPVEPGQVPDDWVPTDTNFAGDVDLADTPGSIVDMAPLRDYLLVYKRDAIHTCKWVGGNSVFAFKRILTGEGLDSRDCLAEHNGVHYVLGLDDVLTVDGNTAHSIIWGRIKRTWLADMDPARSRNANFVSIDYVNQEVLFHYISTSADPAYDFPDKVLVLSLRNNSWTFRDYSVEMPHALPSLDVVDQTTSNLVFYGIDRGGNRLLDLESAPDRLGSPVPAYFTRTGLFGDPGHDWVQVNRCKLNISGSAATLKLGDQIAIDAAVTWRGDFAVDPATDYKTDARANGNLIAYRVDVSTLTDWQASSLMLNVQRSGERG